jgi:hypothetical protein
VTRVTSGSARHAACFPMGERCDGVTARRSSR